MIIFNPDNLEKIKSTLSQDGAEACHVLADFDRTMTKAFVDGKKVPSQISLLRDGDYLTPDYREKAHQLFDKYHAIEKDPNVPIEEKKKAMREWWTKHFDMLIETGLEKQDIESIAKNPNVQLREGASEFIKYLKEKNIPLVIMSSSGVGDAIDMMLKNQGLLHNNIHTITNHYIFDEAGKATGVEEPIIHTLNKDETAIQNYPPYEAVKDKKNVILLGDGLGDLGMVEGFDYDNLLKIGFLNYDVEENLENYKKSFDIVIADDGDFKEINNLMKEIF